MFGSRTKQRAAGRLKRFINARKLMLNTGAVSKAEQSEINRVGKHISLDTPAADIADVWTFITGHWT